MKNILLTIVLIAGLSTSCNHLLDEEMHTEVKDEYLNTPAGFEDAVRAAYTPLRSFYGTEAGLSLTVFGTDTYTMGRDGSFKFINQYTGQLDGRTTILTEIWQQFYRGINTCNAIISRADEVPGLNETQKPKRVAEARFLRAHYYFILVQMFGPVHISLEETKEASTIATRSPIAEVYKVITEDLEIAIPALEVAPTDYGRASKPAAEHLLARVLLTRASSDAAQPDDYARAADLAIGVIKNYNFKLLDDFAKVFAPAPGDRHSEVVWAVQYTANQLINGNGNTAHFYFAMVYSGRPGMRNSVEFGRAFVRFRPTDFTLNNLFADRVNDTRYEKSFRLVFYSNNPGTYTVNGQSVTYAAGDTTIWLPGYELPAEVIAKKRYLVIPPSKYTPQEYPGLIKYIDPNLPNITDGRGSRDVLAFRLAETYLIAAEALHFTNRNQEATDYINAVRVRSARAGHAEAVKITPDQINIDFILDERGRELLGEGFRWFDLVRTKKLVERVRQYNPDGGGNIQEYHVLRPIPQAQIDRTQGGKTAFPQNPGY